MSKRREKGAYFYRINRISDEVSRFLFKYYDAARKSGVVIEGKIANPTEGNLAYYSEMMGMDFQMSIGFISSSLQRWLPRMSMAQREYVADSMYDTLDGLKRAGKTENMLKNAYIKFMCWLYYKFERIVNRLGQEDVPKLLYWGSVSNYELLLISILADAGCDVVLVQPAGDLGYPKPDRNPERPLEYEVPGGKEFPADFSLKKLVHEAEKAEQNKKVFGDLPGLMNCTNAWMEGKGLADILRAPAARGDREDLFYNCYCRINGVEDKLTYANELYQFYLKGLMVRAFAEVLTEEWKKNGGNLNRLMNKAVYLLCWMKRYQGQLFQNWRMPQIGCFIYMGGCRDASEALFMKYLARIPVDVLILCPNLNVQCCLEDPLLYEMNYQTSMAMDKFPEQNAGLHIGTAAYHAERELDSLLYEDSGMFRDQQFGKANTVTLRTMDREIKILWDNNKNVLSAERT